MILNLICDSVCVYEKEQFKGNVGSFALWNNKQTGGAEQRYLGQILSILFISPSILGYIHGIVVKIWTWWEELFISAKILVSSVFKV